MKVPVLVLSAVLGLSAVAGAVSGALQSPPALFLTGLELAVVVSSVIGVLVGLGRFREGPAISVLCVGGMVIVASYLGYLSSNGALGTMSLRPWRDARLGAGALLIAWSAADVLMRRPGLSLPRLGLGLVLLAPLAAGSWWILRGDGLSVFSGLGPMLQIVLIGVIFVSVCALSAAAGHFLIRAFAVGIEAAESRLGSGRPTA